MSAEKPGVHISLDKIWEDVQDTKEKVGAMNGKLDRFISLNDRLDSHRDDIKKHDDRLRLLENKVAAVWVVYGIVLTVIGGILIAAINK